MSHPKDRRERFLVGANKGRKRVALQFMGDSWQRDEEGRIEAKTWQESHHRDTTKLCGRSCCANPRHNGWEKSGSRFTMQERKINERDEDENWTDIKS